MENIKVCPHCGGIQFMAHIKRGCLVECNGIDENGNPTFKVVKEGAKNKYELGILRCATCKADVTEADLIGGVPCKNCGKLMNPNNLDENGNCEVCAMLLANPQLQNASQDDLLRLLARAMKGVKSDTTLVAQKEDQAAQVEADLNATEEPPAEEQGGDVNAADAILNGETPPVAEAEEPKPPRKRRAVKRATEQVETTSQPEPENPLFPNLEQQEQAVENLAESQDAPFPDVEGIPSAPPSTAEPPAELPSPVGAGFQMFDNNDDDEPF